MPTINQLIKKIRKPKTKKSRVKALDQCPQKKGVCLRVFTTKPKKPNSAIRKVAKVTLSNGKSPIVYIPGVGHSLNTYSVVLVRGGRTPDVPGVNYKMLREKFDFNTPETFNRSQRRSKFGVKLTRLKK